MFFGGDRCLVVYLYSEEGDEPVHVHVERDDNLAKFWVQPVKLASAGDFGMAELRKIERLVIQHQAAIIQKWHEHFDH